MGKRKKGKVGKRPVSDRHYLYTAAVQSVDADLSFFKRVYRSRRGGKFHRLRDRKSVV